MRIQYVGGSTVRIVGERRWGPENGYVCEIADEDVVSELLTQPGLDFTVSSDDELAILVGVSQAAELALEGIQSVTAYRAQERAQEGAGFARRFRRWREVKGEPAEEVTMTDPES